ncbi:MAG TPA: hypothetical protein VEG84_10640, partial [Thermoanaerobaculia bacterium]|nr:hypothetical protein [Thermoanaerobaculia bacterium]
WLSRIGRAPLVLELWARAFWPLPPRSFDDLYWLPRAFGALFGDPAGFVFRGLGIFCFLVGCFSPGPSRRQTEALLLSPFAFVLIASGFKRYPFSGRLLLFLVPSILLLVAAGGEAVREATSSRSVAIFRILVVLLLFHPVLFAARSLIHPRTREELRPVLQYVQGRRQPGDRIYVYDGAWPAFDYYASRLGLDRSSVLRGRFAGRFGDPRSDADALRGGGRAWLLFAHAQRSESVDDEARLLGLLDPSGRLDARHEPGASGYLYAFGSSQPAPSPKEQSQ